MGAGNTIALIKALAKVDPETIQSSVDDWLDDHPEATTTVEDGSITKAKLDSNLQGTVDEVSELSNAINVLDKSFPQVTGYDPVPLKELNQIATGTTTGVTLTVRQVTSSDTDSLYEDCNPGDVFLITATGFTSYRTYCFLDSSSVILSMSTAGEALNNRKITAPANATKIIVNAKRASSPRYVYKLTTGLMDHTEFAPTAENITSSNVTALCSGDANNIPNNNIYGINIAYSSLSHMPSYPAGCVGAYKGTFITFGKQKGRGYGDTQIYIDVKNGTWVRMYTSAWSMWQKQRTLLATKVLGIGDSICEGWRNEGMGFAGMLGLPYANRGTTGATLGYASGHAQIYSQITENDVTEDLIIANGGINDYYFDVPLGTASTHPVTDDTGAAGLDTTTVSGGLEYLFYQIIKKRPTAQRYFLITHKTRNYPYTACSAGYTQEQLHDRIVEICNLYNVKVIDVYKDGIINSEFASNCSPTAYSNDNKSVTTQYLVDKDGIHPLWWGYQAAYLPVMLREIEGRPMYNG